jgi:heme exporter protein B
LAASETRQENWWDEVRAVFVKDLRSELRTKAALAGIAVFSMTAMMLISYLVVTRGPGLTLEPVADMKRAIQNGEPIWRTHQTDLRAYILSSLYWTVLYFSAMAGIPRVFLKEEEQRTSAALRLAARYSAVFTGKLMFNAALMAAVSTILAPALLLFMQPEVTSWPLLLGHLYGGAIGLAGAGTILGAISAKAHNRGFLMVVLGFGPLLPILVLSVNGMTAALQGGGGNNLVALVSYVVVMVLAAAFLYEKVWEA